ncbi:MAG: hypothetical protein HOW73_21415 [Polyangiaceae bacterium]|nr:hypothetical protein [Polyangiaceae bacterium]
MTPPPQRDEDTDDDALEDSEEVRAALTTALHDELKADGGGALRWVVAAVIALVFVGFVVMFVFTWVR